MWTAVALPLLVASATLTAAPSASAGSAACTHPSWVNKDSGSGYGQQLYERIRTGPSSDCPMTTWVPSSQRLYYHCYWNNSAGNNWTHVRVSGTEVNGWIWNGNLNDGGSRKQCAS
ncbi:SH3 domain-containing protein [Streptomyces sp. NPDC026589]|uniref:SH3 domain-containing protein n=1 Tax=Streptomyces sp. NPDC026589 TaxID=3155609 RepID=UPI0033D35AD5